MRNLAVSDLLRLANPMLRLPVIYRKILKRAVVVFLYHEVSDHPSLFNRMFGLNVPPKVFYRQMELIRDRFTLARPHEILDRDFPRPGALITFDDGNAGFFRNALPILKEMGIPSLAFLNLSTLRGEVCWSGLTTYLQHFEPGFRATRAAPPAGDDYTCFTEEEVHRYLERVDAEALLGKVRAFRGEPASPEDLEAASRQPLAYFGNHLYNHHNATRLGAGALEEAYRKNQEALDRLPRGLRYVSYPFGRANQDTHARLFQLGAEAVFVSGGVPNFHRGARCFTRISMTEEVVDESSLAGAVVRNVLPEFFRSRLFNGTNPRKGSNGGKP
jgi:peptidoglycan/xylan/chitin deacetylase (PgdA/CDA1 family)